MIKRQESTATFRTISGNPSKSPNTVGNNFFKFKTIDLNNERLKDNLSYIEDFQYELAGVDEYHETLINDDESETIPNDLVHGNTSRSASPRFYKKFTSSNFFKKIYIKLKYYTIWKPFLTLLFIGIAVGVIASILQILTEYLNNVKMGYCKSNWLLNKSYCCSKKYSDKNGIPREFLEEQCVIDGHWQDYSNPLIGFATYGVLSILYSTIASLLIFKYAPFASGGGISEIKMSLRGFQYNNEFYSLKTTIIKCIALPLTIASGINVGKEGPSVHYATSVGVLISEFMNKTFSHTTASEIIFEENTDLEEEASIKPVSSVLSRGRPAVTRSSSTINKISRLENSVSQNFFQLSEYMLAGAAGGVALAFAAPIGGVLFIFEELCSNYIKFNITAMWKCYFITMVGITILKIINPFRNGEVVQFEVRYNENWRLTEIPVFIIIGIFGGVYGILMKRMNIFWINFRNRYFSNNLQLEIAILTILTFVLSYFNSFLKLDMTESMKILFHECSSSNNKENSIWDHDLCKVTNDLEQNWWLTLVICASMLYALVTRFVLVAISYGCKLPCGIFIPSMSIGALFGRLLSIIIVKIFVISPGTIIEGSYAVLGAAAALTGMTHLTISCVIIIFELTGAFNQIVPTMVTIGITRIIIDKFDNGKGIAEDMCLFNKFPYLEDEPPIRLSKDIRGEKIIANDIMTVDIVYLKESITVNELKVILQNNKFAGFPIVNKNKNVVCYVYRQLLEHIVLNSLSDTVVDLKKLRHLDYVIKSVMFINKSDNILMIHDIFNNLSPKLVFVQDNFKLVGLITKKDLIKFEHDQFVQLNGEIANQFKFNESLIESIHGYLYKIGRICGFL
ncbi:hypothetical protein QEN19_003457 [Hanseniaspora menglaensis]